MALIKQVPLEEEFKKNPELKESDLQMLRDWCAKQPHLPKISDFELVLFLHSNYYKIEASKRTIDEFYTYKTHVPEFFSNRDPIGSKELRQAMSVTGQMTMKNLTREGYKVIYTKLAEYEASRFVYNDAVKYFCMVTDIWLQTEGTCIGHIIVVDMHGTTIGHIARLNPLGLKKFLYFLQEALPVRLKGLHFINTNSVMDLLFNMMKPFLKQELMAVLHMHSSMESAAKFLPPEVLTNELGGTGGPVKELHAAQVKKLEDHRAWFLHEEKTARVNESARPGKSKSAMDLFGVEGTFKKLEID